MRIISTSLSVITVRKLGVWLSALKPLPPFTFDAAVIAVGAAVVAGAAAVGDRGVHSTAS